MKRGALILICCACAIIARAAEPAPEPRGGRVGWARLITGDEAWNRHSETDERLSNFIRKETSLNIDPTWYSADPHKLDQLCLYPLIFTNNLTEATGSGPRANLKEYLRRGGFLFVDACTNRTITRDPDAFYKDHVALMRELVPGCAVRELPATHEIFRHYFTLSETPPHTYMGNVYDPKFARYGLYGVYSGDRMVALLSLAGLQCGWAGMDGTDHAKECMKMVVNIYVYAMTR